MSEPAVAPATRPGPTPARCRWTGAIAAVLLVLHFALAVGAKFSASTTSDEIAHLTAGVSYWQHHDYRLHPENGILPQRWAALPWWLSGPAFPPLADNGYWRTSDVWVVGHQLFYESGQDHFPRLMAGRAMIALFSVGTGLLVFAWSRRLFGDAGGLLSLAFFAFHPDFLAHGALVTSDACMTFFFLAACGAWWRHLHDGRAVSWWLSAVTLGLAFIAKFSAVLLLPVMLITAGVRAFAAEPLVLGRWRFTRPAAKFGAALGSMAGHGIVTAAIIWIAYGFRYSAFNPELPAAIQFIRSWEFMEGEIGGLAPLVHAAREWHVLPEAFLYGFAYVVQTVAMRSAFLNGEYSLTGWPTFFLWTFVLKTTLPLLLASLLLVPAAVERWRFRAGVWRGHLYRVMPLVALFSVYWASSVTTHLNIGHRHILPTYPVLLIGIGALAIWLQRAARPARLGLAGLTAWHAAEAIAITPHHLAYFNQLAGGPENGWRHLVDSSLDWGQDLPGLEKWLKREMPAGPVYLSYFGTGEPLYYGILARRLPFANNFKFATVYVPLEGGTYCVSATMLQHVYSPIRGADWSLDLEREYQELRRAEPAFAQYTAAGSEERARLERDMPPGHWQTAITRFDLLRFARLCHYLRVRPPDDHVGYSIFIHRLTDAEVAAATAGTLREWEELIARAVDRQ